MTEEIKPLSNPVLRYFFDNWIRTSGEGWTHLQVFSATDPTHRKPARVVGALILISYAARKDRHD